MKAHKALSSERRGRLRKQEQNHTKATSDGIELLRSAAGKDCLWPISETTAAGRRVRLLRDGKTIAIAPRVDKPMLQRWHCRGYVSGELLPDRLADQNSGLSAFRIGWSFLL